tara:strand:- start:200 stop:487 length:288 start_codon:yes stop_codon:yes gene_type:complete
MSRYKTNKVKKLADGREVYRTKVYPQIPLRDDDIYVATQTGDRLDTLAAQYYNDSTLWWIIASANKVHNASLACEDGTVLRIPQNYIEIRKNFNQ